MTDSKEKTMIYFDNAATTFPKPAAVVKAVSASLRSDGNPGRGAHALAMRAASEIYSARKAVAAMFGASAERVIFTSGATHSLNLAIGAARLSEGAILISDLEHNSVLRPARASLREVRIFNSYVELSGDERDVMILADVEALADGASVCVCNAASNVCGADMPIAKIGAFCRERGILFIVDAAQAGGAHDIDVARDNIDVLCLPAHKGLYGPMGCGIMILGAGATLPPLLFGGSGAQSRSPEMPELPPERYEAGTLPTPLIAGLRAGIEFVREKTPAAILAHEEKLSRTLKEALLDMRRVQVYVPHHGGGIVLFNVDGMPCEEVAAALDGCGICTRAGLHCAPLAHDRLGSDGAVRVSFGISNTKREVRALISALEAII